jgi:tRNA modification GTPase
MKLRISDTIVAIATPPGVGAISIVRVSGPAAIAIAEGAFRGNARLSEASSHTIHFGRFVDKNSDLVDEVLVSIFRTPTSYTGEDMAEVNCHGGAYVTRKVLATLIEGGARLADPGEFTKRAFLNGKMDLSQAEAVADLISAGSEKALRNSHAQLRGKLGGRIGTVRADLLQTCALLELQLDFSEEDVALAPLESVGVALQKSIVELESISSSFKLGRILRDGAAVAIVGRPNVGKSSLFNRLLMEERSIVSSSPGTTRDFLEESVEIAGMEVRLFDTAGLRVSSDAVEAEGVQRTKSVIGSSDLVLLVVDSSIESTVSADLLEIVSASGQDTKVVVVVNKIDLCSKSAARNPVHVEVSAVTGEGLPSLRNEISNRLIGEGLADEPEYCLSSGRHRDAIARSRQHLRVALSTLQSGTPLEFVESELLMAASAIGEITGEVTTDEILETIFSKFCIGK